MASYPESSYPDLAVIDGKSLDKSWKLIGAGGFGQVYKARHLQWRRDVAIKRLCLDDGTSSDKSFLREAELMQRAESPHVIQVLGVFKGSLPSVSGTHVCLVMELMERGSLCSVHKKLNHPPLPWSLVFRVAHQVALGMNHLHGLDPPIIHKDLKPDNILLDKDLNVKITDFGLSKFVDCSTAANIKGAGTTSYMPPEALISLSYKATPLFDVYSYGILLCSTVKGKQPYDANPSIIAYRVPQGQRPSLDEVDPEQATGLEDLVKLMERCWHQEPDKRPLFPECTAVTEALYEKHEPGIKNAVHQVVSELDQQESEVDVPSLPPPPAVPISPSSSPSTPHEDTDAGVAAAEVEPAGEAEAGEEEESLLPVVEPPPPPPPPTSPSTHAERPVSALSALEWAGEISPTPPGKKTPPCDQRILQALEKDRRKFSPATSTAVSPTPEEPPISVSPTCSLYELPPIDYDDQNRPVEVNGFDHKKPARPPTVDLTPYLPPPALEDNTIDIPATPDFSEGEVSAEVQEFEDVGSDAPGLPSPESPKLESWGNGVSDSLDSPEGHTFPETDTSEFHGNGTEYDGEFQDVPESTQDAPESSSSPVAQDIPMITGLLRENSFYESGDNVYENIATAATKKKGKGDGSEKRKGPPKNPYAETQPPKAEEKTKMGTLGRFGKNDKKAAPPEGPDEKELRKREKQRLEKEKKELKEREKKEGEMKKKFKITGQEEGMYQATVTVTTKGRKNDLQVKSGDLITIIRTTNCPKGKWLARDGTNTYGYIAVEHVELDIKELLELGKRAAKNRRTSFIAIEPEAASQGSRTSNQYPLSTGSFTDDSEEWTCDDEDVLSSPTETSDPFSPAKGHTRTHSVPDMGNKDVSIIHQHNSLGRHEALQKLATFFHAPKPVEEEPTPSHSTEEEAGPVFVEEETLCLPDDSCLTEEVDADLDPDMIILPPPDLFDDDDITFV